MVKTGIYYFSLTLLYFIYSFPSADSVADHNLAWWGKANLHSRRVLATNNSVCVGCGNFPLTLVIGYKMAERQLKRISYVPDILFPAPTSPWWSGSIIPVICFCCYPSLFFGLSCLKWSAECVRYQLKSHLLYLPVEHFFPYNLRFSKLRAQNYGDKKQTFY